MTKKTALDVLDGIKDQILDADMCDAVPFNDPRQKTTENTAPTVTAHRVHVRLDMPTPVEVAAQLSDTFTEEQACDIAEHVYQPILEFLTAQANARIGNV